VTVKYHTGVDMKRRAGFGGPKTEPHGRLVNAPIQVDDDLDSIIRYWASIRRVRFSGRLGRHMGLNNIDIAVTGAAGRMGQRLVALARADGGFNIVGAVERPDHPAQGKDAGEVCGIGPIGTPITFDLKKPPRC